MACDQVLGKVDGVIAKVYHCEIQGPSAANQFYLQVSHIGSFAHATPTHAVLQVLVACGIAYRGLDLPDVAQVINYDVPLSLADYARRLGRTGRAGRPGTAVTLVTPSDGSAVALLVAVLRAGGQQAPDWLTSLADGTSESTVASAAAGDGQSDGGSSSASSNASDAGLQPFDPTDHQEVPATGKLQKAVLQRAHADEQHEQQTIASRRRKPMRHRGPTIQGNTMFSVSSRGKQQVQFGSYLEQ